jgi:hypothetical protein
MGRRRWWKPTTRVLALLLPDRGCLLTRSQCRAARRGRAFVLRHAHRCAYSHRIDRMLATDHQKARRSYDRREPSVT